MVESLIFQGWELLKYNFFLQTLDDTDPSGSFQSAHAYQSVLKTSLWDKEEELFYSCQAEVSEGDDEAFLAD